MDKRRINDCHLGYKIVQTLFVQIKSEAEPSPVTGMMRSFLERFLFPSLCYQVDTATGAMKTLAAKKPIGCIYTMNASKEWCDTAYAGMCNQIEGSLASIYGCEVKSLKVYNTCQVKNYADYDMDYFSEADKHQYRDEHFEEDKKLAFKLGKNIMKKG